MWNKDNRVFSSGPRHLRKRQKEKKEGQGNEGEEEWNQRTNEISQLWFDLSHVMPTPKHTHTHTPAPAHTALLRLPYFGSFF